MIDGLFTGFLIILGILFFVTIIEYITGAERSGLKMIFMVIIGFLIISFLVSALR